MACGLAVLILAGACAPAFPASEDAPPYIPPYEIPTYSGERRDFKAPMPPIKPAPRIDGDGIFRMIVNCYPVKSKFALDVDAIAGLRMGDKGITTTEDIYGISRYYVGIVAKLPLYSATELDRAREREYQRRTKTAAAIAKLMHGLADRRRAQREIGLYASLEARSQKRVAMGITKVEEQIGYMEKVAAAQAKLDDAAATIEAARLELVGQCRDGVANEVNAYLKRITR